MFAFQRPARRRSQPAEAGHAQGGLPLAALWTAVGNSFVDAVSGAVATRNGSGTNGAVGGGEIGLLGNGSSWWTIPTITLPKPYTVVVRGYSPNSNKSMLFGQQGAITDYFWLNNGSGSTQLRAANNSSTAFANSAYGTLSTYVVTVDAGGNYKLFREGALLQSVFLATTPTLTVNAIGNGYSSTTFALNTGGGVSLFAALTQDVGVDRARELSLNPWQLFEPSPDNGINLGAILAAALAGIGGAQAGGAGDVTTSPTAGGSGGAQAGGAGSLAIAAGLAASSGAQAGGSGALDPAGTIALSTPVQYKMHQRDEVTDLADIDATGTYTGTPSAIQARFNGGSWATIDASPSGGTWSGTLSDCAVGQGTFEVRFANDSGVTDSVSDIGVGDIFIVAGQSNHSGRASTAVQPANAVFTAVQYGNDGTWKPLQEANTGSGAFDDQTGATYSVRTSQQAAVAGSYFGRLSTLIEQHGVPTAFVPVAMGSTAISAWLPFADHRAPSTLYGQALLRAEAAGGHRAMLWYQGEGDAGGGTSQATYESRLVTLVDSWFADTGKKTVVYQICRRGSTSTAGWDAIRAAQVAVPGYNSNAILGPDLEYAWTSTNIHYLTQGDIESLADIVFARLAELYGYTAAADLEGVGGAAAGGIATLQGAAAILAGVAGATAGGTAALTIASGDLVADVRYLITRPRTNWTITP